MNGDYVLTLLAEDDLNDAWDYAAENFGFDVADAVLEALESAFGRLAQHPEIGRVRENVVPRPYAFWRVGPAWVVYRNDLRPIQIVRVIRTERDRTALSTIED